MSNDWEGLKAFDAREFRFGEIYRVKDKLVDFPESRFVQRTYHSIRCVVIIHHCNANLDKRVWTLNAAPVSSQTDMKRDTDLEIEPCEGNYINKPSLIRLGAAQPFLKIDLDGPVGRLSEDQQKALSALQLKLAGVL